MSVVAVVEAECPVWTGHFSLAEIYGVCVCGRVEELKNRQPTSNNQKKKSKAVGETVQTLSMKPIETGRVEPRFQIAKREGPELLLLSNQEQ